MKQIIFICFALFFVSQVVNVNAAVVYGTIYDLTFNPKENVIVEVNSAPKQVMVSKDGSYRFILPKGNYTIHAYYKESGMLISEAKETIEIEEEGEFVVDLILNEVIGEDVLSEVEGINFSEFKEEKINKLVYLCSIVVVMLIITGFILLKIRKKEIEIEDNEKKVLEIIKRNGGRITQKELRKNLPFSEAKVSLIISDLESRGIVRKIKKGRGNIIILQRKKRFF